MEPISHKYQNVSSFFSTERVVGFFDDSEPKPIFALNDSGKWISDAQDGKGFEAILEELNEHQDEKLAQSGIQRMIISSLSEHFSRLLTEYQKMVIDFEHSTFMDLSKAGTLSQLQEKYDDLVMITKSKALTELKEFSEQEKHFDKVLHKLEDLVAYKKRAMKYIKAFSSQMAQTDITQSDTLRLNVVQKEIIQSNLELVFDDSRIMDFAHAPDTISMDKILVALAIKKYAAGADVIKAFSQV